MFIVFSFLMRKTSVVAVCLHPQRANHAIRNDHRSPIQQSKSSFVFTGSWFYFRRLAWGNNARFSRLTTGLAPRYSQRTLPLTSTAAYGLERKGDLLF